MEDDLMFPCTEVASSLMNFNVDATAQRPHFAVSSLMLLRFTFQLRGVSFSVMMYMLVSVSMVSRTLIMPGCLRVRNLRKAFLASGRRGLFFCELKVNIEHDELSS